MKNGREPVSVIVPVVERTSDHDLAELYEEYSAPLRECGWDFEFIFVLEPWAETFSPAIEKLAHSGEPVRILHAGRVLGEAGQLKLTTSACRGQIILSLPAYPRVEPACLPLLIERVTQSSDLAIARRWPRRDASLNRMQNRLFHLLVRLASGQNFRDIGCGVRAMRRELLEEIPLYGDAARFLPLLAVQEGFTVEEVPCAQHPSDRGMRVYSVGTYTRRALDLLGLFFLLRFTYRPLRFFGLVGALLSGSGGLILVILLLQRLMGQGIADRPLLLLGVLLVTLGVQIGALGLVGELIVHLQAPSKLFYRIRERV